MEKNATYLWVNFCKRPFKRDTPYRVSQIISSFFLRNLGHFIFYLPVLEQEISINYKIKSFGIWGISSMIFKLILFSLSHQQFKPVKLSMKILGPCLSWENLKKLHRITNFKTKLTKVNTLSDLTVNSSK